MIDKLNSLKNRIFFASFGLGLASTVAIFNPNQGIKQTGFLGFGGSIAGVVYAELLTGAMFGILRDSREEIEGELKERSGQLTQLQKTVDKVLGEFSALKILKEGLEGELARAQQLLQERDLQLIAARSAINQLETNLATIGKFSATSAYEIVRDTYNKSVKKLESLLDALSRNYPSVADELHGVYLDVDKFRNRYLEKLHDYESLQSFNELLDAGLSLQENIIDRCVELKVKAQSIVIRYLNGIVQESVPFSDYESHIESLTTKAIEQIEELKLENERNTLAIAQEWVESNNRTVENYNTEFAEIVNTARYSVGRMQEMEAQIQALQDEITALRKPLQFYGESTYANVGNDINMYYYKRYGYKLDAINWQETDAGYQIVFAIRNSPGLSTRELYADNSREQLAALSNCLKGTLPEFEFNYQNCTVTLSVIMRRVTKPAKDIVLKDILTVGNKRSWLITGHPGAGKTSVMIYLGQQLGGQTAQRIALNPHTDEQSAYEPYGFVEINDLSAIVDQINLIYQELELRRQDKTRRFKLVVVIDELGAILDAASKPKELMLVIRQIAVEGRKLELIVIVGNHSQTTKAIEMDAEFRNAFYQLFLVGAARYAIDQPNRSTGLKPSQEEWIKNTAYPSLLLTNGQYSLIKHPTHGDYEEYKDSGNPPENLEDWEINLLSIAIARGYENYLIKTEIEPNNEPIVLDEKPKFEPIVLVNEQPNLMNPQNPTYKGSRFLEFLGSPVEVGKNPGVGSNPTQPSLTQSEIELINKNSDKLTSEIVSIVWGVKPSKASQYQTLKAKVDSFLDRQ